MWRELGARFFIQHSFNSTNTSSTTLYLLNKVSLSSVISEMETSCFNDNQLYTQQQTASFPFFSAPAQALISWQVPLRRLISRLSFTSPLTRQKYVSTLLKFIGTAFDVALKATYIRTTDISSMQISALFTSIQRLCPRSRPITSNLERCIITHHTIGASPNVWIQTPSYPSHWPVRSTMAKYNSETTFFVNCCLYSIFSAELEAVRWNSQPVEVPDTRHHSKHDRTTEPSVAVAAGKPSIVDDANTHLSFVARQKLFQRYSNHNFIVMATDSRISIVEHRVLERARQLTYAAYRVTDVLPLQPFHIPVTSFSAKVKYVPKQIGIAYATGPTSSVMVASSTPL